jgi:hypothetical protein
MQTAKLDGNFVEVGDDVIAGQLEVVNQMGGQRAIAAAGQQLRGAPDAAVAMQRHRDLDVIQELGQTR